VTTATTVHGRSRPKRTAASASATSSSTGTTRARPGLPAVATVTASATPTAGRRTIATHSRRAAASAVVARAASTSRSRTSSAPPTTLSLMGRGALRGVPVSASASSSCAYGAPGGERTGAKEKDSSTWCRPGPAATRASRGAAYDAASATALAVDRERRLADVAQSQAAAACLHLGRPRGIEARPVAQVRVVGPEVVEERQPPGRGGQGRRCAPGSAAAPKAMRSS
jgi:hypothetical protein